MIDLAVYVSLVLASCGIATFVYTCALPRLWFAFAFLWLAATCLVLALGPLAGVLGVQVFFLAKGGLLGLLIKKSRAQGIQEVDELNFLRG